MVNWGVEYTHSPRKKEKDWANKMVNAGADLILGDQAHWVQQHEKINNKHVTYGLGNYIFDQHWSEKTTEGIIQKFIYYNNEIIAIDTIPIKLSKNGRVKPILPSSNRYLEVLNAYYSNKTIVKHSSYFHLISLKNDGNIIQKIGGSMTTKELIHLKGLMD